MSGSDHTPARESLFAAEPPRGKPIPGVTNEDDVTWALDKARRFIFRGGDRSDPRYKAYLDRWLDYLNHLRGRSS